MDDCEIATPESEEVGGAFRYWSVVETKGSDRTVIGAGVGICSTMPPVLSNGDAAEDWTI
jgi:hypothetical protein